MGWFKSKTMTDYDERIAYVNELAEAKGYSQEQVDFLKDCAEWADDKQWTQIYWGLGYFGVDVSAVSAYADPRFNYKQMAAILFGIIDGVDVSVYADPKFDVDQMNQIKEGLDDELDVSTYADPKFSWEQMEQIRERLEAEKN